MPDYRETVEKLEEVYGNPRALAEALADALALLTEQEAELATLREERDVLTRALVDRADSLVAANDELATLRAENEELRETISLERGHRYE